MSIEFIKDTTVVAKKSEIEKLYGILYNLPEMPIGGMSQKNFRAEPNYAKKTDDFDDSYFTMDRIYVCETEDLDDESNRLYSLTISTNCYNCIWDAPSFLQCNNVEYEWLVESEWNEREPYADAIYVENTSTWHTEKICFVGGSDESLKEDSRYKNKSSDFVRSGLKFLKRIYEIKEAKPELWDKSEMLKRKLEVLCAINTLEGGPIRDTNC